MSRGDWSAARRKAGPSSWEATCEPCHKRIYRSRSAARSAAKEVPGRHMTPYRCPVVDFDWHVGHLPEKVIRGRGDKRHYQRQVERRRSEASE